MIIRKIDKKIVLQSEVQPLHAGKALDAVPQPTMPLSYRLLSLKHNFVSVLGSVCQNEDRLEIYNDEQWDPYGRF